MTRADHAKELFLKGYACSNALTIPFCDLTNISETEMLKLSLPLGGGLGRLRLTCGAISGMALIIGLIFSKEEVSEENKLYVYGIVQELTEKFKQEKKTLVCEDLLRNAQLEVEFAGKPEARTDEYYKKRPCANIVYLAAKILEDYLISKNII